MEQKSLKIEKWTTSDKVKNAFLCLLGIVLIFGVYVFIVNINTLEEGVNITFREFFSNIKNHLFFLILESTVLIVFDVYFVLEDRNFIKDSKNLVMFITVFVVSILVSFLIGKYVHFYLRPLALSSLLVLFLLGKKYAFFSHITSMIIMLLLDVFTSKTALNNSSYLSFIIGTLSGMVAIFSIDGEYSRLRILGKSFLISIPALIYIAVFDKEFISTDGLFAGLSILFSGPLSVSVFMIFIPFFELIFSKATCFMLAESSDHKATLLNRLIHEAPGTFNHSVVVSNLAEACALAIGEDPLLTRTCAYYHDIGKLRRPEYFVENQSGGKNPHDDLTPELSANIIKAHTTDGYKLMKKEGFPEEIATVCLEHQGTLPIRFFYEKAKKFVDSEVNINDYCYLGPKPHSRISAIIMIADGCEAATRTITDRSNENVTKVVKNIIDYRKNLGQFDECEITLNELSIIEQTLVSNFSGIYHSRIEYPNGKKSRKKKLFY